MPHLIDIALKRPLTADERAAFPFSVPAIGELPKLDVNVPITIFVGENGSGKSTLLEGIAAAAPLPALGAREVAFDETLGDQRRLGEALRLAWRPRSRRGFFLRAEDFFGHLRFQARTDARIARERAEIGSTRSEETADGGLHVDEREAARFTRKYDSRSHGESFLDLFTQRLHPRGLYLLDEPEAPLSPKRQLVVLELIVRAAKAGAQFIIATHSPILLSCPGARIFAFDAPPITEVSHEDLEHVNVTRDFLNHPDLFLRHLV